MRAATEQVTRRPLQRSEKWFAASSSLAHRDWLGYLAIGTLAVLVIFAIFGTLLVPNANDQDLLNRLVPPVWSSDGSWEHVLGTDQLGRDVLGRIIVGTRLTLLIGFAAAGIEVLIGATLGLAAGYRGGWVEAAIMRWTDIQMSFPTLLLILLILLTFGSNSRTLIFALGLNGWMIFARLIRAEVKRIRDEPYVQSARVTGMKGATILRVHIVPQIRSRIVAVYLLEVPRVILSAAGLSFLGLGVSSGEVTWGLLIGDARSIISVAYWPSLFAGLAIVASVASLYIFASWLEPHIDPLRRRSGRERSRIQPLPGPQGE